MLRTLRLILLAFQLQAIFSQENGDAIIDIYGVASGTAYVAQLTIGTPIYDAADTNASASNTFRMILDTGSSNDIVLSECCTNNEEATTVFICSASESCVPSTTEVTITYGSGGIQGNVVEDTFSGPTFDAIESSPVVAIQSQEGFLRSDYEGILGLAYPVLTQPMTDEKPSTFLNTLMAATESQDVFGMLLCGTLQTLLAGQDGSNFNSGVLIVGGFSSPDGVLYAQGTVYFTPIAEEAWYRVIVTNIALGDESLEVPCDTYNEEKAIIDSGSTNIILPTAAYNAFREKLEAVTLEAIPDFNPLYFESENSCCGLDYCSLTDPDAALLSLPDISISLALEISTSTTRHVTITIGPEYYWRPELNGEGFTEQCRALGIAEGPDLILGNVFMEGLYIYHDRDEQRIGIAAAANCPNGVTSSKEVVEAAGTQGLDWCTCLSKDQQESSLVSTYIPFTAGKCFFIFWWMYVVAGCVFVMIVALIALCCICCKRKKKTNTSKTSAAAVAARTKNQDTKAYAKHSSSSEFNERFTQFSDFRGDSGFSDQFNNGNPSSESFVSRLSSGPVMMEDRGSFDAESFVSYDDAGGSGSEAHSFYSDNDSRYGDSFVSEYDDSRGFESFVSENDSFTRAPVTSKF